MTTATGEEVPIHLFSAGDDDLSVARRAARLLAAETGHALREDLRTPSAPPIPTTWKEMRQYAREQKALQKKFRETYGDIE